MDEIDKLVQQALPLSPEQLYRLLATAPPGSVVPLDASWFSDPAQAQGRSPREVYTSERIPGARFLDMDAICDRSVSLARILPQQAVLEEYLTNQGVGVEDLLVVYDYLGNWSSPWAAWVLRAFQHRRVLLLDNYPLYRLLNFPVDIMIPHRTRDWIKSPYRSPGLNRNLVANYDQVMALARKPVESRPITLLDMRPESLFSMGHVPGAVNVPYSGLSDPSTGQFKTPGQLRKLFANAGVLDKDLIIMCCTGMMASMAFQALVICGSRGSWAVYEGSWAVYNVAWADDCGLTVSPLTSDCIVTP